MKKFIFLLLFVFGIQISNAEITTQSLPKKLEHIDISKENKFFRDLYYNEEINKEKLIEKFKEEMHTYNPTALYSLASYLYINGDTKEAVKYAVMGRMRARFDYRRSTHRETKKGIEFLEDNYAKFVPDYIMQNPVEFQQMFEELKKKDTDIKYLYNPEWIYLYSDLVNGEIPINKVLIVSQEYWRSLYNLAISEVQFDYVERIEGAKQLQKSNQQVFD